MESALMGDIQGGFDAVRPVRKYVLVMTGWMEITVRGNGYIRALSREGCPAGNGP